MRKLIDFKLIESEVQKYADEYCDGNFNMAVRILVRKGLKNE